MSIKMTNELMEQANAIFGENNSDDVLSFLADLSDTLENTKDAQSRISQLEQEKQELDSSWRKKYRDRFFSSGDDNETPPDDPQPEKPKMRFEDLFTTKG